MNPERLLTSTLRQHPAGNTVTHILAAALAAVEPGAAVRRFLTYTGQALRLADQTYDLTDYQHVYALAFGKAAMPMLAATVAILGERLDAALAVTKAGQADSTFALPAGGVTLIEAGHPVPDQHSIAAGQQALAFMQQLGPHDLVVVLISGGGSALLTAPVDGVSLADLQTLTRLLLACGAPIQEMNTLRKHLDLVKGGGLARAAGQATMLALVLSDVIGDPLDMIASGPTVPDPTTYADALAILERYDLTSQVPASILAHLHAGIAGHTHETLKPGQQQGRSQHVVVGSNRLAAEAAAAAAHAAGYTPLLLTTSLQGEAREVGQVLAAIARESASSGQPVPAPCCIIAGGETTVTLRGNGRGGRNQELALATVAPLAGQRNTVCIALASDGGDGPTDAAGAVVTGDTLARAQALGLDPHAFLACNDAYHFFQYLGDLLLPGPTNTNVNDLVVMLVG